jgi:predicted ferric reductase
MEPMELIEGPLFWFANRGTGVVLLLLLTLTTVLGVLSTRGDAGRGLPRFVTQAFHRNLSMISLALLVGHVATAVLDTYVDIRWWQSFVPFINSNFKPLKLGLGTLALDLMVVVMVTSLIRHRVSHRPWRVIHVLAYACWGLSLAHSFGSTDADTGWGIAIGIVCAALVGLAVLYRLLALGARRRRRTREQHPLPSHVLSVGGNR